MNFLKINKNKVRLTSLFLFITFFSISQNALDNVGLTGSAPSAVALSLRKLSSSYTGNVLLVRRSTDNAEATIAFDASNRVSDLSKAKLKEGVILSTTLGTSKIGTISTEVVKTGTIIVQQNKTGTITYASGSAFITGVGTQFLTELTVGDVLYLTTNEIIGTVLSITDDLNLTITGITPSANTNISFRSASSRVIGVGTNFLSELSVGSRLFNASNTYLGTVKSISSNTALEVVSFDATSTSSTNYRSTSNVVTGNGTSFLTDVAVGDMIVSNNATIGIVQSIQSNTSLTLSTEAGRAVTSLAYRATPAEINFDSFYSGASVFVKTWYDQSGNGRDLIQRTASNQPRIVNAGTPHTLNTRIAIQFGYSGISNLLTDQVSTWLSGSYTINKVTAENNLNPSNMNSISTYGGNGPTNGVLHFGYRSNNQLTLAHYGNDMNFNSVSTTDLEIHTGQFLNVGSRMYRNGGLLGSSTTSPGTFLQRPAQLSVGLYRPTNTTYYGFFTELISFPSVILDAERTILETNQINYYAIDRSVWTGAVNNDWNNTGNWTGNIPTLISPTVVVIPNVTNKPIITATTAFARSLTIETGSTVTIASDGVLKLRGTFNGPIGGLIATNGTIEFDGSTGLNVPITLLPSVLLQNTVGTLIINSSNNVQIGTTNLIVKNNLIFNTGKLYVNGLTLTLNGTITNNITQGLRGTSNSNLVLNSSSNTTLSLDQSTDGTTNLFKDITINSGANTVFLGNKLQSVGNLTIQSGVFDIGSNSIDRTSSGGILQINSTGILKIGGMATLPLNYATHIFGPSATVEYAGSNQTISTLNSSQNYGNLLLSGSGTKTVAGAVNVVEDLRISTGVKMNLGSFTNSTNNLYLAGANQITGSYGGNTSSATTINSIFFTDNTGILNVNSNQLVWTGATSTIWSVNSNWLSNAAPLANQDVTIPATATRQPEITSAAVCRNLTLDAGTTLGNSSTLTIAGNLVNNGATISGAGTIAFSGAANSIGGSASSNLLNLSIRSGANIALIGNHSASSLTFVGGTSSSSLTHSGNSSLTIAGTVTIQQPTANTLNHSWNINNGTATVGGLISYNGTNTTNTRIQEIVITNGTLNANGGITFATVNNLARRMVMSGGAGRINLAGALTLGGTSTLTSGNSGATFSYSGITSQTLRFFTSGSYYNLEINNPTDVTLAANLTSSNVTGNLDVISGTLKNGGFSIAGGASRTFSLASRTSLFLSGSNGFPSGFGYTTLVDSSTVEYNSTLAQTIGAASYFDLILNGARTTRSITLANSGTIEIRNSLTQLATFTTGGFIATGSTVNYSKNSGSQSVAGITYNKLTLSNSAQKIAAGNMTVNGELNCAANISSDIGHLEMTNSYGSYASIHDVNSTSVNNNLDSYILTMGASAFNSGVGDVTGKIRRISFADGISYTFGNPNMKVTLQRNGGTLPTQLTVTATIGSHGLHVDKDGTSDFTPGTSDTLIGNAAVKRLYQVNRTGGTSVVKFTVRFPYNDSELNGNSENGLVTWDHHLPYGGITPHEHGKTSQNTTENWVELANHGITYLANEGDVAFTKYWMISQKITKDTLWIGAATNAWNLGINWSSGAVPFNWTKVIIDKSVYNNELTLAGSLQAATMLIRPDAVLNGSNATLTLNGGPVINGGAGTWVNLGRFKAGTSTVIFNNVDATLAGNSSFYNVTIPTSKKVTVQAGSIDTITNVFSLSGTLDAMSNENTFVFAGNNQTIPNPINSTYYHLTNAGTGTAVLSSNFTVLGDFSVNAGNLNFNGKTIDLKGNLYSNSSSLAEFTALNFSGIKQQVVAGSVIPVLKNSTLSGTEGLKLNLGIKISQSFNMQGGNIITASEKFLEIGTSKTNPALLNWTTGNVVGPMKRWFAAATNSSQASGIFPVGNDTLNRLAQINFTSAPEGGYLIVDFVPGLPPDSYSNFPFSFSENSSTKFIQNADEIGYWNMTPYDENGTAYAALNSNSYNLLLRLNNPTSVQNGGILNNPPGARLIRAKSDGNGGHSNWELAGTYTISEEIIAGEDYKIGSAGVVGFSWFGVGGDNENPLPVELLSFTGICNDSTVEITWKTASENNSSNFKIEKSDRLGENWNVIHQIDAAGNSNQLLTYSFSDYDLGLEENIYRLKQIDIDGKEKIYGPIIVDCYSDGNFFSVFPNPSDCNFNLYVRNKALIGKSIIQVMDANGSLVFSQIVQIEEGMNLFNLYQCFPSGLYFIKITNGKFSTKMEKHIFE